ncbi:MAG: hypothetical protein ABIH52_02925 [Candidatus Aenigmatarchaeota archaeon]|nr:hypothetical protein [Nanoarchaeota archaeon]
MRELITIIEDLKQEINRISDDLFSLFDTDKSEYHTRQGYSILPSHNLEDKVLGLEEDPEIISEEEDIEEEDSELMNPYILVYKPARPDYFGFVIRKVSRQQLGYGILGRAFPYLGLVEIASDLYGNDFEEVRTHEILHMQNSEKSEMDIRTLTRMSLPFTPRWH